MQGARPATLVTASLTVVFGSAMTLCVRGYRFGESNHAVYLVDALRRTDPSLLRHDWWTQSTLQYHFVFNALTTVLMRLGVLEPAFLVGYIGLALLLHVAWRKLTLRLGGTDATYLLSVVLFYVLAGGLALGTYHFLQDGAFLPSNIANVAMLWGVYLWVACRPALAGICLGIAGLFHINHALAGLGLWAGALLLERRHAYVRPWVTGTVALVALSAVQVVPALRVVLSRTGKLPLEEFVDLFVRVRHPHHFDPRAWPLAVWLSFLVPVATVCYLRSRAGPTTPEQRRAWHLFALFLAMTGLALAGAGLTFVSETLVQLNLYRFTIYPKLLGCVATAWVLYDRLPRGKVYVGVAVIALLVAGFVASLVIHAGSPSPVTVHNLRVAWVFAPLAVGALALYSPARPTWRLRLMLALLLVSVVAVHWGDRPPPLGFRIAGLEGDDADYRAVCEWARANTPVDAVFVVPPDEESFRLYGRRAIVVNFKGVPQLSAELPEWRDRLLAVLDLGSTRDLLALPRPMGQTLLAIRNRYEQVPPGHLVGVARRYGARYVVCTRRIEPPPRGVTLAFDRNGRYFLYDLSPEATALNPLP